MSGKYLAATDVNFKSEILDSDKVALVDFWATWCGPCMMLGPVIEELAGDYEGKAVIAKLNVDENPEIAAKFGIRSIPALLLFKNGKVLAENTYFKENRRVSQLTAHHDKLPRSSSAQSSGWAETPHSNNIKISNYGP